MSTNDYQTRAMNISGISIALNVFLSLGKLVAGIVAHSGAMVSDAVHSASDVFSTVIVMAGIKISGKAADKNHPFGHERMECVASILLAVTLAMVGTGIGIEAVKSIIGGGNEGHQMPGLPALIAAVVSIAVKEIMFQYTRRVAKEINSSALMADAWHHRSDALSSIGALAGIIGARMGYWVMDPLASFVICVFILKATYEIFKDAMDKLVDHACDSDVCDRILEIAMSVPGVIRVDSLKTRMFGAKSYVEIEIAVDGEISLKKAHDIAVVVHDRVESEVAFVKHCTVHENPY